VLCAGPATVVVCTRDRSDLLGPCLERIVGATRPGDRVLVVASGEDVSAVVPAGVELLTLSVHPKTAKLNAALARHVVTDVIVATDDDCIVAPGWVAAMVRALEDHETAGIAFGPVDGLSHAGDRPPELLPHGLAPQESWAYAHGASMAFRRTAVAGVGGFDERLGPGALVGAGEEADMVARLAAAGWTAVIADAPIVSHASWRSSSEDDNNVVIYERGAGAWLGAGLRRDPRRITKLLILRLAHEARLLATTPGGWRIRTRMAVAFLKGFARGLTFAPRRWIGLE
jgi:GT2 family glycosyltransferase